MVAKILPSDLPAGFSASCLHQAPLPLVMVVGPQHEVQEVNSAFCCLINKSRDQVIGHPIEELLPGRTECRELLERVRSTGKAESQTETEDARPGVVLWSYRVWPVMIDDQPRGLMVHVSECPASQRHTRAVNEALLLGALRQHELKAAAEALNTQLQAEIVERKVAEDALRKAQAELFDRAGQLEGLVFDRTTELSATNEQMEAFVYSIAHDLRAPLRTMKGFSGLLIEEASALNDTCNSYAHHIHKAAAFMDAMLSDLLAFSRISQQQVTLTPVNLQTVVESVLSRLEPDVIARAQVESPGPWPSVRAHQPTLIQILYNLVSNGLKFVRPGVPAHLCLRTELRGPCVRVWVEDNGIGIAPEHQPEIFQLFTRIKGEAYDGTGIGLAIVQKGVERMEGRVGVESTVGQGSRFWFELDRA